VKKPYRRYLLYDVFDGKEIFSQQYQSEKDLIRQLAHNISNDIYKEFTNLTGMLGQRSPLLRKTTAKRYYAMDWDGHRVRKLNKGISSLPHTGRPTGRGSSLQAE
jgi:hypothetical protein